MENFQRVQFLACPNFPKCKNTKTILEDGTIKEHEEVEETDEKCPNCNANLVIKNGKNGKFLACPNFPKCKFTKDYIDLKGIDLKQYNNVPCEKCGATMVLKTGKKGVFLACPNFPKCKNTHTIK